MEEAQNASKTQRLGGINCSLVSEESREWWYQKVSHTNTNWQFWRLAHGWVVGEVELHGYPPRGAANLREPTGGEPTTEGTIKSWQESLWASPRETTDPLRDHWNSHNGQDQVHVPRQCVSASLRLGGHTYILLSSWFLFKSVILSPLPLSRKH